MGIFSSFPNNSFVRTIFVRVPIRISKEVYRYYLLICIQNTLCVRGCCFWLKFFIPFFHLFKKNIFELTFQCNTVCRHFDLIQLITTKLYYLSICVLHACRFFVLRISLSSFYEFVLGSKILHNCYCQKVLYNISPSDSAVAAVDRLREEIKQGTESDKNLNVYATINIKYVWIVSVLFNRTPKS